MCSLEQLQALKSLAYSREANLATEYNQRFKKRRRILAPANGHPNWLEHRSSLQPKRGCSFAQSFIQCIMLEARRGQHLQCMFQHAACQCGIALLGNQFGRIVWWQLRKKEKISRRNSFSQQLDAFADERCDGCNPFRCSLEPSLLEKRLKIAAEFVHRQRANMF